MVGGYVLVDATGLDVSDSSAQTVSGLYAKLEAAQKTGKMVIITGVVNGDSELTPIPCSLYEGAGIGIVITTFTAVVTDDDEVTPVTPSDSD